jgi:hypothetical protein
MQQGRRQPTFWGRIEMQLGLGVNLFNRQKEEGVPVRDGLVAEYRFDEGRGQVLCDYSGNGNHGTLGSTRDADTNDPLWTPQGLRFDGVDDYVSLGTRVALPGTSGLTVHAVVCSNQDVMFSGVIAQKYMVEPYRTWSVYYNYDKNFQLTVVASDVVFQLCSIGVPVAEEGVYNEAAFTFEGGVRLVAYRKGLEVNSISGGVPLAIDNPVAQNIMPHFIGKYSSNFFNGVISYIAIYNRALSPEEVQQNYQYLKTILAERGVILE